MPYYHLDSHIEISAKNYPAFVNELGGDPQGFANAREWKLDVIPVPEPHVTYISLLSPISEIDTSLIDVLAKYVRPGDWIALQRVGDGISVNTMPVQECLILFDGSGNWSTSDLLWSDHNKFLNLHELLSSYEKERDSASIAYGTDSYQSGDADQHATEIQDRLRLISNSNVLHTPHN